ncbi:MAG: hypothetical protein LBK13_10955 [Spirochaetales bacterium]|nr:hypothetical protein [Spirochaetales bacterium]
MFGNKQKGLDERQGKSGSVSGSPVFGLEADMYPRDTTGRNRRIFYENIFYEIFMRIDKKQAWGKFFSRRPVFPAMLCAACFFISCGTTRNAAFIPFDEAVARYEYLAAADELETAADSEDAEELYRAGKDEVLRYLDTGILYHIAGEAQKSIERLSKAEYLIEDNYTKSISDTALSFLINDYSLVYCGEAYEDVYLNIFQALDYLRLNSFDDAYVEIQRAGEKLNFLEDKYGRLTDSINEAGGDIQKGEIEFHNSALARYVSVLLYRTDGRQDSAALDMEQLRRAFTDQPDVYDFDPPEDLDAILAPSRQARLNVIAFAGLGPEKRDSALHIIVRDGVIALTQEEEDEAGNMTMKDLPPVSLSVPIPFSGMRFNVPMPSMRPRGSRITGIRVLVDGQPAGGLSLLEKLDKVAMETFKLNESIIRTRTVIRAVLTGGVAATAKYLSEEMLNATPSSKGELTAVMLLVSVSLYAGGAALDAVTNIKEEADLRLARYFPGKAYVGEFLVEPGGHEVAIEFLGAEDEVLYTEKIPRRSYDSGKLNLLTAYDLE